MLYLYSIITYSVC